MTDAFERAVLRQELARSERMTTHVAAGVRVHATVYVAVNVLLLAIWAFGSRDEPWFLFPLLGWGIGLAAHVSHYRTHLARDRRLRRAIEGAVPEEV